MKLNSLATAGFTLDYLCGKLSISEVQKLEMTLSTPKAISDEKFEISHRLGEYKRLIRLTSLLGAGLLAEVAVFNALPKDKPEAALFVALFVTFFFCAGLCTALVRGGPEYQIDVIESYIERRKINKKTTTMGDAQTLSGGIITLGVSCWSKFLYYAAIFFIILSAGVLLFQVWFTFLNPVTSHKCPAPPTKIIDTSPTGEASRFNLSLYFARALTRINLNTDESRTKLADTISKDFFKTFAAKTGEEFAYKIFEPGSSEQIDQHTLEIPFTRLILFDHDSAKISEGQNRSLSELVDFFRRSNNCRIDIRGAADGTGSEKYNLWLSWQRANAVAKVLIAYGLDPGRIQAIARGSAEGHPGPDQYQRRAEARVSCEPMIFSSQ